MSEGGRATAKTPLVPIPDFADLSPTFQELSCRGREHLGVQVNSVHAFSHSEDLGAAARRFFTEAMTLGILSRELRLLIRLAVSNANECRYCRAHQIHQLHGLGVPEHKILAIAMTKIRRWMNANALRSASRRR